MANDWSISIENIGVLYFDGNGFLARKEYSRFRTAYPDRKMALLKNGEPVIEFDPDDGFMLVEVTDTFGGEANYSWVRRYKVRATTYRGAMGKVPGYSWNQSYDTGEHARYNAKGACVCAFIGRFEAERCESVTYEVL